VWFEHTAESYAAIVSFADIWTLVKSVLRTQVYHIPWACDIVLVNCKRLDCQIDR
jgi:hypothetical protein